MALLNSISSANAVIEQGATYMCESTAAISDRRLKIETQESQGGGTTTVGTAVYTVQWRMKCALTARYSYVGIDRATAMSEASSLRAMYTKNVAQYGLGCVYDSARNAIKTLYVGVGSAPICGATVTPVHVDGEMWRIDVDVAVEVEGYSSAADIVNGRGSPPAAPTASSVEALVSAFVSADSNVNLVGGGS